MTVQELIEHLQTFPPEANVMISKEEEEDSMFGTYSTYQSLEGSDITSDNYKMVWIGD